MKIRGQQARRSGPREGVVMFNLGDKVLVVRGDGFTHSAVHTVTRVGVQFVEIEDGRQFIRTTGEWISEFAGSQPIKWSYPTIIRAELARERGLP